MIKRMTVLLCVVVLLSAMLAGCGGKETPEIKTPEVSSIGAGVDIADPAQKAPAAEQSAQLSGDTYTVRALIPSSWANAYLWAWSETEGDLFAAWPGESMDPIGSGWYTMDIPVEYDYVIVNDNGGEYANKTQDCWTDGMDYWIIWEENNAGYYFTQDEAEVGEFVQIVQQGASASQDGDTYTVYTQVPSDWADVRLWAWSETEGDLFAAWPGEPMTQISDCWYAMDIPVEYDYMIVNDNGSEYITQTQDIWTMGQDSWVIWDDDDQGYLFNNTDTMGWYDEMFDSMAISDEKSVSEYLNTLSAIQELEPGLAMKMEYGFNSWGVQEFAYVYYYSLAGMSDAEASEGIENVCTGLREMFGHLGFVEVRDDLRNEYFVVTVHFRGLDDAANAREMVNGLSQMMGTDASGMLDGQGRVILDSVFTLENSGFYVKLG